MMPSPLIYLKKELNFTTPEWITLSEKDKDELKQYAIEEMIARGLDK